MVLNIEAAPFGDACIAAMSIVAKVSNLLFSVCVGIGQGFQPVSSFNYGAGKYSRVKSGIKFAWGFSTIVIFILSLLCFIFAPELVTMFRHENEVVEVGTSALRMLCASLVVLPTVMIGNMTFQSIGKSGRAFFLALTQNGLFFIPLVLILPEFMGINGIEAAQPIAYVIAAIVTLPFIITFMKHLPEDAEPKEMITETK